MIQKPVSHACCGTPSSMAYWLLASLLAWGLRSLVGLFWHPLGPVSASTIWLAIGIGWQRLADPGVAGS